MFIYFFYFLHFCGPTSHRSLIPIKKSNFNHNQINYCIINISSTDKQIPQIPEPVFLRIAESHVFYLRAKEIHTDLECNRISAFPRWFTQPTPHQRNARQEPTELFHGLMKRVIVNVCLPNKSFAVFFISAPFCNALVYYLIKPNVLECTSTFTDTRNRGNNSN